MPAMFPQTQAAMNATATLAQLHHLLDAGQAHSATYQGLLSNHLPMAQQALLELGASEARLAAWSAQHAGKLEPQAPPEARRAMRPDDLGRPQSEAAWRAHFAARVAEVGAAAALRESLPVLLPGAGAIAFHGLIRTGHAVLAGHEGEIAAGLAHWAAQHLPLPGSQTPTALDLPDWLAALSALPRPTYPAGSFISHRMQAWGESPGFAAVASRLAIGPTTLHDIARLAARTYALSRNFTVLHLLTASHAMTVLEPWWPTPALPAGFVRAAAAGLLASGATPKFEAVALATQPWPTLTLRACAQDDEHVIKLVHAAWRLARRWPEATEFAAAAERAVLGAA